MRYLSRAPLDGAHTALVLLAASLFVTACESASPTSAISPSSIQGSARAGISDPAMLAVAGARIFSDPTLSLKQNQSCATCHDMQYGFTSPNTSVNANGAVMFGSVNSRFGTRKPPSLAYATQAPVLYYDPNDDTYVGGNFWDGRATGARLGNASAEQSELPFVNSVEQALPDAACVIYRVSKATYINAYVAAYDARIKSIVWPSNTNALCQIEGSTVPLSPVVRTIVNEELDRIALAIAAFEASPTVNSFSSKYDLVLAGRASLTALEEEGRQLYEGQAGCAGCHPNAGAEALMTDYTYDNIGVPANPKNPGLLANPSFRDLGLGGVLLDPDRYGQQKVPTLRNIDRRLGTGVKSFMHNGAFKSLEQVVHFYNTRDVLPDCATTPGPTFGVNCWPAAEVLENVNTDELGNLGLTPPQETALVAYLKTLSDGYVLPRAGGPGAH
ncbi:MAG: cytochrome c peroxidase [bacterium]